MAVLLPERPDQSTIAYAHRYGIDVIYRTPQGSFDRAPAPEAARTAILSLADHTPHRDAPGASTLHAGSRAQGWQAPATQATRSAPTPATVRSRPGSVPVPGLGR